MLSRTPKFFKCDPSRDQLTVDVNFFQMDLSSLVNDELIDSIGGDIDNLPSWTKFADNPYKASGFFSNMLRAVFLGDGDSDTYHLNSEHQFNSDFVRNNNEVDKRRVAMLWVSGRTKNKNLKIIGKIANNALNGFHIITISGDEHINGKKIKNKNVEQLVKEELDKYKDKPILIISARIAQRSFSIPDITEIYLCYDSGSEANTIQKISRSLTFDDTTNKIAHVVSLSFDPFRDDKFTTMILKTAINYKHKFDVDINQAIKRVLDTVNIFKCTKDGAIPFNKDEYLNTIISNNSLSKIMGNIANIHLLTEDELLNIANNKNISSFKNKPQSTLKGKTYEKNSNKSQSCKKNNKDLIKKAREKLITIIENIDIILGMTREANTIEDALKII